MNKVFIIERKPCGFDSNNFRAFSTREKAADKIRSIYSSQLGWTPQHMQYKVTLHENNGLAFAVEADGTTWKIIEIEVE